MKKFCEASPLLVVDKLFGGEEILLQGTLCVADIPSATELDVRVSEMSGPAIIESLSTILGDGVSSLDEQIVLVSQCGKKFPMHEEVAKASTEYFTAALQAGMTESGKSEPYKLKTHTQRFAGMTFRFVDIHR
jgi:hypothetical protein